MTDQTEPLREVIARHGLSASKALGQNFILDRQLLARIAAMPVTQLEKFLPERWNDASDTARI